MLTECEILSIDQKEDSCVVRMPIFETANDQDTPVTATAHFCYMPGGFAGFKVGDIVYVGFENNRWEFPVVLGRVGRGIDHSEDVGGNLTIEELSVSNVATLPVSTMFVKNDDTQISMKTVLDRIQTLENYISTLVNAIAAGDSIDFGGTVIATKNLIFEEIKEDGTINQMSASDISIIDEETGDEISTNNLRFVDTD